MKTKRTLAKRIKISASGKIMRKKIQISHLKNKHSMSVKHRKNRLVAVGKTFEKRLKSMLPGVK